MCAGRPHAWERWPHLGPGTGRWRCARCGTVRTIRSSAPTCRALDSEDGVQPLRVIGTETPSEFLLVRVDGGLAPSRYVGLRHALLSYPGVQEVLLLEPDTDPRDAMAGAG